MTPTTSGCPWSLLLVLETIFKNAQDYKYPVREVVIEGQEWSRLLISFHNLEKLFKKPYVEYVDQASNEVTKNSEG